MILFQRRLLYKLRSGLRWDLMDFIFKNLIENCISFDEFTFTTKLLRIRISHYILLSIMRLVFYIVTKLPRVCHVDPGGKYLFKT